jgi:hypothetical protein
MSGKAWWHKFCNKTLVQPYQSAALFYGKKFLESVGEDALYVRTTTAIDPELEKAVTDAGELVRKRRIGGYQPELMS